MTFQRITHTPHDLPAGGTVCTTCGAFIYNVEDLRAQCPGSVEAGIAQDEAAYRERTPHTVELHDDGPQGMIYIWMCPKCGQPLREGGRCNSGVHEGPNAVYEDRPTAVRSIDLVELKGD